MQCIVVLVRGEHVDCWCILVPPLYLDPWDVSDLAVQLQWPPGLPWQLKGKAVALTKHMP